MTRAQKKLPYAPVERLEAQGEAMVLFIHGFMGGPDQFGFLMDAAEEAGLPQAALLLPGHGCTWRDFSRAGLKAWEDHVKDAVSSYGARYKTLFLAGHSMGGLLGLNESIGREGIGGLFLIAPPLRFSYFSLASLRSLFRLVFFKSMRQARHAYGQANSISKPGLLTGVYCVRPAFSLFKLMRKARRALGLVRAPVTAVCSKADETVSVKSARVLRRGLVSAPVRVLLLENSLHAYYTPEEREILRAAFLEAVGGALNGDKQGS